jgi:hypothetical protein
MKDNRNIDDLFKERLGDFKASPPEESWQAIRAALDKKKRRRVIPLWWRAAGIAALLALILTVGNVLLDTGPESDQPLTEESAQPSQQGPVIQEPSTTPAVPSKETRVATQETVDEPGRSSVPASVANQNKQEPNTSGAEESSLGPNVQKALVAETRSDKEVDNAAHKETPSGQRIVDMGNAEKAVATEKDEREKPSAETPNNPLIRPTGQDPNAVNPISETGIAVENMGKTTDQPEKPAEAVEPEQGVSIFDAIAEEEEKEVEVKDHKPADRWEVTPSVGPVYYSSLGNGSSIDPSFADNSQTGDVNFSYGAQVSYAISEKLAIRTGVHNVNLSYTTGGVELGTGPVNAALRSVDYGNRSTVTTAVDKGTLTAGTTGSGGPFGGLVPKSAGAEAFINQSLRYFEIPLELKYTFLESRFGVHVIGGFSSLVLADDEISVEAGDFNAVLGPANNLNSLSFTTNIGLGFDYKIGKKLKFNVEPMFKYQVNPYSDSSVDFNPYYLGVYSGLTFKF